MFNSYVRITHCSRVRSRAEYSKEDHACFPLIKCNPPLACLAFQATKHQRPIPAAESVAQRAPIVPRWPAVGTLAGGVWHEGEGQSDRRAPPIGSGWVSKLHRPPPPAELPQSQSHTVGLRGGRTIKGQRPAEPLCRRWLTEYINGELLRNKRLIEIPRVQRENTADLACGRENGTTKWDKMAGNDRINSKELQYKRKNSQPVFSTAVDARYVVLSEGKRPHQ